MKSNYTMKLCKLSNKYYKALKSVTEFRRFKILQQSEKQIFTFVCFYNLENLDLNVNITKKIFFFLQQNKILDQKFLTIINIC